MWCFHMTQKLSLRVLVPEAEEARTKNLKIPVTFGVWLSTFKDIYDISVFKLGICIWEQLGFLVHK